MKPYVHRVQYYETDKMGITHHSNYFRWMEEARVDFLDRIGWSYDKLEENGIFSPVTAIDCRYANSTTFADEIEIRIAVREFRGVRLVLEYTMQKCSDGTIACTGHSEHCFLNAEGKLIRLKKEYPDFYQTMVDLIEPEEK
ncbi:MAG: acyl-CoA thioesterase [Eubacteriales bacterium]|nr:acyl-CoA thioesterase [Eubacteriales bacterium]